MLQGNLSDTGGFVQPFKPRASSTAFPPTELRLHKRSPKGGGELVQSLEVRSGEMWPALRR